MNVVIVGGFWFPHGAASAARIRNLAHGLRECGARVHVIGMVPQPRGEGGVRSLCPEISYEYAAPTAAIANGWQDEEQTVPRLRHGLLDKVRWFAGLYGATPFAHRLLRDRIDRGECDLVVVYDRSVVRMTPLARLCRARGVKVVLDVVEASEHLRQRRLNPLYWDSVAGARATPRLFDGVTAISEGLESFYRARGCAHTLVLPSIEAWPPAAPVAPTGNQEFRLAYVGALQERDAPDVLVDAMRVLAHRRTPVVLDVVGHYERSLHGQRLQAACNADPALASRVRLRGALSDRALGATLASADGLLLTRRAARTEELSFPTRLVEYLRHGRPVFVSDVGDVALYLRDGHEAILLHPRDPLRVASAVNDIVRRADRGAAIGLRGREAGARHFDRRVHAGRLLDFVAHLPQRSAA